MKKRTLKPSKCRNLHDFRLCRTKLYAISALPTWTTSFYYCFLVGSSLTCSTWHHRIWIKTFILALTKGTIPISKRQTKFCPCFMCHFNINPYLIPRYVLWRRNFSFPKIFLYTNNRCEGVFRLVERAWKLEMLFFHLIWCKTRRNFSQILCDRYGICHMTGILF